MHASVGTGTAHEEPPLWGLRNVQVVRMAMRKVIFGDAVHRLWQGCFATGRSCGVFKGCKGG